MGLHAILLVLVFYHLLFQDRVQCNGILSKDKQLKLLNKPAVKTIVNKYGDTYDCVDFYKQLAFDHPLLKNQTFDLQEKSFSLYNTTGESEVEACPVASVPIRRITKDALIRERQAYKDRHMDTTNRPGTYAGRSHCFNTRCSGYVHKSHDLPIDFDFSRMVNYVEWGAAAYAPPGSPLPQMGSGNFPIGSTLYDAYIAKLELVNEKGQTFDVKSIETYADDSSLYPSLGVSDGMHHFSPIPKNLLHHLPPHHSPLSPSFCNFR